jgi:hypothetical protein
MLWHSDPLRPWRASRVHAMLSEVGAVAEDLSVMWPPTSHEACSGRPTDCLLAVCVQKDSALRGEAVDVRRHHGALAVRPKLGAQVVADQVPAPERLRAELTLEAGEQMQ